MGNLLLRFVMSNGFIYAEVILFVASLILVTNFASNDYELHGLAWKLNSALILACVFLIVAFIGITQIRVYTINNNYSVDDSGEVFDGHGEKADLWEIMNMSVEELNSVSE